jgi:hypothetical protein
MTSLSAFTLLASHGGGFGLNLNLFETNIINLAIVIAGLVWFLKGFLGGILDRRRQAILSELKDAEERLAAATTSLAAVKKDLADAQQRAETIRAEGQARAEAIRLRANSAPWRRWPASSRIRPPIWMLKRPGSAVSCAARRPAWRSRRPSPPSPASSMTKPRPV